MRYVFFGTPEFAAIVLQKLLDASMPPCAVVCNPDKPVGRKKIITPPPVKKKIANSKSEIDIFQPDDIKAISYKLEALRADLFVVAAYAKILPKDVLAIPRLGCIGVHPSLLPTHRGAAPIQAAILSGEETTGVTIFLMDEKTDHGPILASRKTSVANRTYGELLAELAATGGDLLVETLQNYAEGNVVPRPQDDTRATYAKKFTGEDGFVAHEELERAKAGGNEAMLLWRKIRALNPEPGVYTIDERGKRVKLLEAALEDKKLMLKKIQVEGKQPVNV